MRRRADPAPEQARCFAQVRGAAACVLGQAPALARARRPERGSGRRVAVARGPRVHGRQPSGWASRSRAPGPSCPPKAQRQAGSALPGRCRPPGRGAELMTGAPWRCSRRRDLRPPGARARPHVPSLRPTSTSNSSVTAPSDTCSASRSAKEAMALVPAGFPPGAEDRRSTNAAAPPSAAGRAAARAARRPAGRAAGAKDRERAHSPPTSFRTMVRIAGARAPHRVSRSQRSQPGRRPLWPVGPGRRLPPRPVHPAFARPLALPFVRLPRRTMPPSPPLLPPRRRPLPRLPATLPPPATTG